MANRFFNQFRLSLEKQVVDLFAKVTIGASGAATLARGKGIASVVRDGAVAGKYTLTLQDRYVALLDFTATFQDTDGITAAPVVGIVSEDVDGAKTIVFQCSDVEMPAATDPGNGETMYLHVTLSNTTAI
jgi:rhamnogalacturonyl hydrolase YesR